MRCGGVERGTWNVERGVVGRAWDSLGFAVAALVMARLRAGTFGQPSAEINPVDTQITN